MCSDKNEKLKNPRFLKLAKKKILRKRSAKKKILGYYRKWETSMKISNIVIKPDEAL